MTRTYLAEIPVIPVLAALGMTPDDRGRYFCLFHDDDRPGGKPSAEVRDDPTLLWCWSCGAIATAAGIVAEVKGVSLEDGMRYALDVAGTIEAALPRQRKAVSSARLEAEVQRLTTNIRFPRGVDPVEQFVADRSWPPELAAYLRDEWGWIGDYRGRVIQPHRSLEGELTGLRFRVPPDWRKDGRRDSRFRQLYGAWRGVESDAVWICEGETDTVWAAWHLEPEVNVLGVTTAAYRPRPEELELLRDRLVVLVFDGDQAGDRARARWAQALAGVGRKNLVLRLDEDRDLCDSIESPNELWRMVQSADG